jgi:hypothetical protein
VAFQPKECQHVAGDVVRRARVVEVTCHGFLLRVTLMGNGVRCCVLHLRHGWHGWSDMGYIRWRK